VGHRCPISGLIEYYAKHSWNRNEAMDYVTGVPGIKKIGEDFGLRSSRETRVIAARVGAV